MIYQNVNSVNIVDLSRISNLNNISLISYRSILNIPDFIEDDNDQNYIQPDPNEIKFELIK